MRLDLVFAIFLAAAIHAAGAFAHKFFPGDAKPAAPDAGPAPTIALAPLPQIEPEPQTPEENDTPPPDAPEEAAPPLDLAPAMQADLPAPVLDTNFQQAIQPPPPPQLGTATSLVTLPRSNFNPTASVPKNIFDLNQLDQKPAPTFDPKPNYPYEMRRSRISGRVTLGFMIDASGNPVAPHIISSSNQGFEEEALRTVLRSKFRPGKKGGKAVITRKVVRDIVFTLPPG
jgi:protein TonB